jgi:ADP-ribose pyrophosphatase
MTGRQEAIRVLREEVLSKAWGKLVRVTFEQRRRDGRVATLDRECYGRGDGAVALPCDVARRKVILVRQFRLPVWMKEKAEALWEAPAGLLDEADPAARVKAEAEEETGYRLESVEKLFEAYSSPGSFTERMHYFIGRYGAGDRIGQGGGLEEEGEDIEVVELDFDAAFAMIASGEIRDAKTIILLQHAKLAVF